MRYVQKFKIISMYLIISCNLLIVEIQAENSEYLTNIDEQSIGYNAHMMALPKAISQKELSSMMMNANAVNGMFNDRDIKISQDVLTNVTLTKARLPSSTLMSPQSKTASVSGFRDQAKQGVVSGSEGQVKVSYKMYPPKNLDAKGAPMVLHLYGAGGSINVYNMMREPYKKLREQLWAAGYWVVVPDLGPSHWMNKKATDAIDTILDFMINKYHVDSEKIHILGTSMGAGSGLRYLYLRPNQISSMVAIFPMTDFAQWCQEAPRFLSKVCAANGLEKNDTKGLSEISPSSHIKAYKDTPIFLLHGTNDKLVPIGHSRGFAAALKAERCPVVLHEVPGLGHNDAVVRNYQNAIFNFFDKGINTTK